MRVFEPSAPERELPALLVFWAYKQNELFFSRIRIVFLGSAKTGVLRKQNPGFCAARAAIERLLERFSRFRRPNPVISNGAR